MSITKALNAKAEKHLAKLVRVDGVVMTYKQHIEKLVSDGAGFEAADVPHAAARIKAERTVAIMNRGWVPTGNENHPETIRYRKLQHEAKFATHKEYRAWTDKATFSLLSKTQFDYGVSIGAKVGRA